MRYFQALGKVEGRGRICYVGKVWLAGILEDIAHFVKCPYSGPGVGELVSGKIPVSGRADGCSTFFGQLSRYLAICIMMEFCALPASRQRRLLGSKSRGIPVKRAYLN